MHCIVHGVAKRWTQLSDFNLKKLWSRWDFDKKGSSVQFSHSVMSNSLWPQGVQHTRPLCPSPTLRACSNSCPLSRWCHPTISSSVVPFSSRLQSFPESGSFPVSQCFASGGQSIGTSASASVLSMNIQDWFPIGWTGWICIQSKGPLRTPWTVWKGFCHTRVNQL